MLTSNKNFNEALTPTRILVAPLDWGLGHATRCIPIIKTLISHQCEVIIAASGAGYFLLKKEFPTAVILRCKSFKIHYSSSRLLTFLRVGFQMPKILFSYRYDRKVLRKVIREYRVDAIISDNRFGMWSREVRSVYITHQLQVKTGNVLADRMVNFWHHRIIGKYEQCWVPDEPSSPLTGALSSKKGIKIPVRYLGALSRLERRSTPAALLYDILVLLSGPEPQRTIFENRVKGQLAGINKRVLVVRGLPGEKVELVSDNGSVRIVNFLLTDAINEALLQSEIVISRSGYTTIMDLVQLGKTAILVPTPGQGEQEYLARHLMGKKYFYFVSQDQFFLKAVMEQAEGFAFEKPEIFPDHYKKVIGEFVTSLKTGNLALQ